MNINHISIVMKENIHLPASFYFSTGYIPQLAKRIIQIINGYEKNSIMIESIDMNNNTYCWLHRLFTNPIENPINPLTATTDNKFIYDYPIKIESSLEDGKIIFNIGE